jgi:Domain of unknown function (DUF1992)
MTTRKPSSVSFPDWVDQQIRTAAAEGAFDNLPGAGKPIPDIGAPQHELAWVASYLRREKVDIVDILPPALALAKEVEALPERLLTEPTEDAARRVVEKLNDRIAKAHAAPQVGPPVRVKIINIDAAIVQWRAGRAELLRLQDEAHPENASPVASDVSPRKRFGRRGRR